jgi:predicted transcriptional regulator
MFRKTSDVLVEMDAGEMRLLRDRLSEADSGEFVCADTIEEWVGSWFTAGELPPPEPMPEQG